jgi:HNH endonuclease
MKICSICNTPKGLLDFYKRSNGNYRRDCKACLLQRSKNKYREQNPDIKRTTFTSDDERKEARRGQWNNWYNKNKEYNSQRSKEWRENNQDKVRDYELNNKDKTLARTRKRQIAKKNQSPKLTQLEDSMIKALYFMSKVLSNSCSNNFNVDHIIPVSKGGLHVFDNLQILTEHENKSKGNK